MFDTPSSATDDDQQDTLDTVLGHPGSGVTLLTVRGEVDTLTASRLGAAFDRLLDEGDRVLAADLTGITFLASSGLAVLIRAAHRATAADRTLRLVVAGRAVRRPLEITGTDRLFDLHTDRAAALAPVHD